MGREQLAPHFKSMARVLKSLAKGYDVTVIADSDLELAHLTEYLINFARLGFMADVNGEMVHPYPVHLRGLDLHRLVQIKRRTWVFLRGSKKASTLHLIRDGINGAGYKHNVVKLEVP